MAQKITENQDELDYRAPVQTEFDFFLDLDGFEGPIDLLLKLSKEQKVDLTKISILHLAEQYLSFVQRAQSLNLELAADYLVMAAWLAYLKSRLLLPKIANDEDEATPEEMAQWLTFQLQRLEAIQKAGEILQRRPQLNEQIFVRGEPEKFPIHQTSSYDTSLHDLLTAYGTMKKKEAYAVLKVEPSKLHSIEEAAERLHKFVGRIPAWKELQSFLPGQSDDVVSNRSAFAATFVASLEMARMGDLEIKQLNSFDPIYIRSVENVGT